MKIRFNNSKFISTNGILAITGYAALTYFKYDLNDVPLSAYRFDFIGNVLNFLIPVVLFLGLIVSGFMKKNIETKRMNLITVFLSLSILFVLISYGINKINFLENGTYILTIPIRKAITGFLLITYLFLTVYSAAYIWGIIFGSDSLYELRTLMRSLSALILLLIFSLFYVWNVSNFTEEKIKGKVFQFGLIPGAAVYSKGKPSPIFAARIKKAFELFKKQQIEKAVLTGGNAPGEITEAEAAKKYLISLGINNSKLIVENETSATVEQIKFMRDELTRVNSADEFVIISDGFHLSRALQICRFFNLKANGLASDYSLSFEKTIFYRTRESVALLLFWFFAI